MRILAAIVTYNRCHLLSRCIDYVQVQRRQPDALVVINNGSTDGTSSMLAERGISVITQENVGSAGGWHRAIQCAQNEGFDAVWLMDDDGFPDSEALAGLEQALLPGVACASSIVVQENRPDYFVFPFPVLDDAELPVIFGSPRKIATVQALKSKAPSGTYPFIHLFNGALVSMAAVGQAGSVNREFFIYGEEVDFFFRLRTAGSVISVLDAVHYHPDVSKRPYNPTKVYYYVKNALILNRLHYNLVWLRHAFMLGLIFYRLLNRNGWLFAMSLLGGRSAPIFYKAILRGLTGKLGKDLDE